MFTLKLYFAYLFIRLIILIVKELRAESKQETSTAPVAMVANKLNAKRRLDLLQKWERYGAEMKKPTATAEVQLINNLNNFYAGLSPAVKRERAIFVAFMEKIWTSDLLYEYYIRNYAVFRAPANAIIYWYAAGRANKSLKSWEMPKEIKAADALRNMVRYLFQKYPVPVVVENTWFNWTGMVTSAVTLDYNSEKQHPDNCWLRFYFYLTEGGSIRKQTLVPLPFSKRTAAMLEEVPSGYNLIEAYWWMVFVAAGGSKQQALVIARGNFDFPEIEFWKNFVRFFADTGKEMNENETRELIELIKLVKFSKGEMMHINGIRDYGSILPNLKLEGWTARRLLNFLREETELIFPKVEGLPDLWSYELEGETYEVVRLVKASELAKEGAAMGHCVGDGGYVEDCLEGYVSIWSLRKKLDNGKIERLVTIALENKRIDEALAYSNEEPDEKSQKVLAAWAKQYQLEGYVFET